MRFNGKQDLTAVQIERRQSRRRWQPGSTPRHIARLEPMHYLTPEEQRYKPMGLPMPGFADLGVLGVVASLPLSLLKRLMGRKKEGKITKEEAGK